MMNDDILIYIHKDNFFKMKAGDQNMIYICGLPARNIVQILKYGYYWCAWDYNIL